MSRKVVFSRSLYSPEAVAAAVDAYAALVELEVEVGETEVIAVFGDLPEEGDEELVDSFCNHALYETVVRHRRQAGEGG